MIVERLARLAIEPFDIHQLAQHCRVDGSEYAVELINLGMAATSELEAYAQLALTDQPIRVTLDAWPRTAWLHLPIAPMVDPLGVTVTVDGVVFENFATVAGLRPAIRLTDDCPCGVIVVTYIAGFGATRGDVPADLVNAVMDQASALFDAKGEGDGKTNRMSPHMARVAARYRRVAI